MSVVVGAFGRPQLTDATIRSLSDQDYPEALVEILLCDDGTVPLLLGSLSDGVRNLENLRYVWQPNKGYRLGRSRNNGIRLALGELVVFVDGDVVVPRDFISRHVSAHESMPTAAIVAGARRWVRPGVLAGRSIDEVRSTCQAKAVVVDTPLQAKLHRSTLPWMSCWGFNFSVPKSAQLTFDESMPGYGHEDYELCCRLYHQEGYRVWWSPELEVFHLDEPGESNDWNPWQSNDPEVVEQYIRNCLYMRDKHHDVNLDEAMWPLTRFCLDAQTGRWRAIDGQNARPLGEAMGEALLWRSSQREK